MAMLAMNTKKAWEPWSPAPRDNPVDKRVFVLGEWTIFDKDREAQRKGKPYWTLIEGEDVCEGPLGRKALKPESFIYSTGYETEGLGLEDPQFVLDALNQHASLLAEREELVKALEIAKADILNFKETSRMRLYPTLEAIDKALSKASPQSKEK